jgi:hypothetical protein
VETQQTGFALVVFEERDLQIDEPQMAEPGRPIADFTHPLGYDDLCRDAEISTAGS